jgi:hypothetical protein
MRFLNDRKGVARVIEAFFAAMLMLSCLTLIPAQANPRGASGVSGNLDSMAQNVLVSLDSDGHLATLIDSRDWEAVGNCIQSALPLTVWFNFTVYDTSLNALNPYPICNGGAVSNTITSVEYVCASPNSTYTVYVVQLQLAVAD